MNEKLYTVREIRTYTGKLVDVFNITPESIDIVDIAHALSNQCRFGGHTQAFYSVAQHCLSVVKRVPKEQWLAALMHDAAEAYLVDLPTPIKRHMEQYEVVENGLLQAIADKFGFQFPLSQEVKDADREQLEWEFANIVENKSITPLEPWVAKRNFINLFNELTGN